MLTFLGKTCLLQVFVEGKFPDGYVPTIFHNDAKKMKHPLEEGREFNMQLWDTAGQVKILNLKLSKYFVHVFEM